MSNGNSNLVQTDREVNRTLERISYGLAEAASAIGVGETFFTELVSANQIPSFRLGRRRLIRKSDLQTFIDSQFDQQNGVGD